MRTISWVLAVAAACGGKAAAPTAASPATQPAEGVAALGWLEGRWLAEDGSVETWTAAGDALFGVGFTAEGFEAMILAAGDDGRLRFTAYPGGASATEFVLVEQGAAEAVFENPEHDFPQRVRYARSGDALTARIEGDGRAPVDFAWHAAPTAPAPALEQADRDFAADTAARGADGWAAWFAEKGAMWRPGVGRIEGPEAVHAAMAPAFAQGFQLSWAPLASGLAADGRTGFTVGEYRTGRGATGAYVSVWTESPAGWRVLFDVGDPG